MINIYCKGTEFCSCDIEYDIFSKIMSSPAYNEDAVVAFCFRDGSRAAVIKKHVEGFMEI